MYAAYNDDVRTIDRFHPIGELTAAKTIEGLLLVAAPLDRFIWSPDMRSFIMAIDETVDAYGFKGKELWLSGIVSERARENLRTMGWTVRSGSEPLR
jgi:hypothetical protein